ncbi:MAG: hypothetical protein AB7V18_19670 [Pyrinomonadaceae bacterium]
MKKTKTIKAPNWYDLNLDHAAAIDEIMFMRRRSPTSVRREELVLIEKMVNPERKTPYEQKEIISLIRYWDSHFPDRSYPRRA